MAVGGKQGLERCVLVWLAQHRLRGQHANCLQLLGEVKHREWEIFWNLEHRSAGGGRRGGGFGKHQPPPSCHMALLTLSGP